MKKHHILYIVGGYFVAAYLWNNYSGSTTKLPGDIISSVL
jgi:hypothetical protein